ncbi:MAG TPA: hypothetical protein P5096_01310 [Patescibacteria group bacterium]|nr:hypothetical protein [Patescibacteria group bacterium]
MEQDQQEQNNSYIDPRYGTEPYEKTRYVLQVMSTLGINLVDLEAKPPEIIKTFSSNQLEEAKEEMHRLSNEDDEAKRKIKELVVN